MLTLIIVFLIGFFSGLTITSLCAVGKISDLEYENTLLKTQYEKLKVGDEHNIDRRILTDKELKNLRRA